MDMTLCTILWMVGGMFLVLCTLPGTVALGMLTLGGVLSRLNRQRPSVAPSAEQAHALRLAVIIPAHDEETLIQRCVHSVRACEYVEHDGVIVVADNCTDATAERARAAGARVLVRQQTQLRGKGHALAFAFEQLAAEPWDAYTVIDADSVVETNLLSVCRQVLASGADAVQARYLARNNTASLRTRLLHVALLAFNVLRPRGREYWGCSVGIFGNGFVLTKKTLCDVPYHAFSVVEDLEYHIRLVRAGRRVRFTDATTVWADMPENGAGVTTQRARWEGGRLRVLREQIAPLLRDLLSGRVRLLEPVLDLLLLPLAFHIALLLLILWVPLAEVRLYAVGGLSLVVVYILAALATCGGTWRDVTALAAAPGYLLWKLTILPALMRAARLDAAWVRTARTVSGPLSPHGRETERGGGLHAEGKVRNAIDSVFHSRFHIRQSSFTSPSPLRGEGKTGPHLTHGQELSRTVLSPSPTNEEGVSHAWQGERKLEIQLDVSIVIVSFNTRELLRECLLTVQREAGELTHEVIVVDNASKDGSADMAAETFPWVRLVRNPVNRGFAAANNVAFPLARGRHVVLLNSDAFVRPGALARAVAHMDAAPRVGLAGARLVGRDDSWQPSARIFPSPLNDLLTLSGLSNRFPHSRVCGRVDRTWADPLQAAEVDWVPGAFSIVRRSVLEQVGYFDERFFLYYEEVDLCRRIRAAGYTICYWPDIVVVHLGGESSKTVAHLTLSSAGAQLTLWRMRSALLYHYKHHGRMGARLVSAVESSWHFLRALRNSHGAQPVRQRKREESQAVIALMRQAWRETRGGRVSPEPPW